MTVSFKISDHDHQLIERITNRAMAIYAAMGVAGKMNNRINIKMDITACHASGTPLRLEALADADNFNFAHDVFGIRDHLDRDTGELTDCFCPRYAA